MKKKAILALVLSLAMLTVMVAACGEGGSGGSGGTPTVSIGVFQPATGDNGAGGRQEVLGTQYAHYLHPTVTIGGVEHEVILEIVDNQSSTAHGPAAAAELVARGVDIILGSYGSAVSMASSDVFLDAGLTAIGVSCTNPGVTRGNDHYFRICFLDPFQGQILASLAKQTLNAQTAYVLALAGDDYSMGLANYFIEAFEGQGGDVVFETFPEGTSDFSAFMTNASASGADVIFSPTSVAAAVLIVDAANIQNVGIPVLAGDTWDNAAVLAAAEGGNVDVYITTFYQEGGAPDFDAGIKEWIRSDSVNLENNGGNDMVAGVTAMGFDAYMVVLDILERAGSLDQDAIRQATINTSFNGPVAGLIKFDSVGDAARDTAFVKKANTSTGEWEFYAQQRL